jgi:GNAT superfamily N-acetyltransferase
VPDVISKRRPAFARRRPKSSLPADDDSWGEVVHVGDQRYAASVETRPATPDDALAVARIHVRSWQAGYRGLLPDSYLDGLRAEDRAPRYTFGSPNPDLPWTQLAVDGDVILGFATTGLPSSNDVPGAGELLALYVDPDHWGRGIGGALLAAACARIAKTSTFAVLWLLDGNQRGARFYTAQGWAPDGTHRNETVWSITVGDARWRRSLV